MNKTMQNMMKPLNPATISANSEDTKRQQESIILGIMQNSPYSMTASDIGEGIILNTFPGYDPDRTYRWMRPDQRATRMASRVCKRLETKGEIVSTLYQGRRLYSIPTVEVTA